MLRKVERPFNEAETTCLRSCLEMKPRGLQLKVTLIPSAIAGVILLLSASVFVYGFHAISHVNRGAVIRSIWPVAMGISAIFGILSFYFFYMFVSSHIRIAGYMRKFIRERLPQIRSVLEDGRASVTIIDSDSAILISDLEDEEPTCIYDLGDGTSLLLRGDDYVPEEAGAPWPAQHFEIVHGTLDGKLVGIFSVCGKLERVRVIAGAEMPASFLASDEPASEAILPGCPDTVLARLQGPKTAKH